MAANTVMQSKATSTISQWIVENRKASIEKERIRAANRERVAQIRAVAKVYCAQVDERISLDANETACRVASANVAVASAHMVAHVVRARCDESIARIAERADQFLALAEQQKQMQKVLSSPGIDPEDREWVISEIRQLRRDQSDLIVTAEHEARRLPPLVAPMLFVSRGDRNGRIQEEYP